MASNSNENLKIFYPEETSSVISTLLEKYGIGESQKEFLEKLELKKNPPGRIIAKIIKEIAENEISIGNLPSILQERLDIPKEKAEKLAKDVKEKILDYVKKVPIEKGEAAPPERKERITPPEKPRVEKPEVKQEVPPEKPSEATPERPQKRDIYREPIE